MKRPKDRGGPCGGRPPSPECEEEEEEEENPRMTSVLSREYLRRPAAVYLCVRSQPRIWAAVREAVVKVEERGIYSDETSGSASDRP